MAPFLVVSKQETKQSPSGGVSMYEISTRPWIYALAQQYGQPITKLADIPMKEFQAIKDMGFDYVWMMG
jgi:hypothetical protein